MTEETFDYIIVGAGSAGCVLAARLSEDPSVTVALVEAGDSGDDERSIQVPWLAPTLMGSAYDWAFSTTAQPGLGGREVFYPRGKVLGGSSAINFMMWIPGHRLDFDDWNEAVGDSWSWGRVEPYLRKSERWAGEFEPGRTYGTEGPLWIAPPQDPDPTTESFLQACAELGLKEIDGGLGGPGGTGTSVTPLNQYRGARWSAADGYLRPALKRANLRLISGVRVDRVTLTDGRATGVELAGTRIAARREVILSAGAVGSPHLLLLSGVGDPDELRRAGAELTAALPGVGRNLSDHLILDLAVDTTAPVALADADTEANRKRYEEDRRGPLTSNVAEAVAFLRADGEPGAPDLELIWTPVAFTEDTESGTRPGLTIGVVLLRPESRGSVGLASADPAAPPVIDPGYLSAPADVHTFRAGVRFAERVFGAGALRPLAGEALGDWRPGLDDTEVEGYVRAAAQTLFHPVGTCRPGPAGDASAVVDERLRVHGVAGLRVVDASVIPTVPRGHTHASVVMVAERAAELIREAAD
ncbi:GMC family oxidoreductase [Streptomyces apocyni]|uniref:GMC family oxidoreductase n=1 Tax=Streptomyces apocyni TaxID=2654677 RepID=UPI0012E9D783|nr:GMC family oxidoreductase N-terminal domain-containing protein [Streptomyces apocyni]